MIEVGGVLFVAIILAASAELIRQYCSDTFRGDVP